MCVLIMSDRASALSINCYCRESKGKLPASNPPSTKVQTPNAKNSGPALPAVTPTTAETRSLPGKMSHTRKQSLGSNSLKTNGSAKNGDSLSRCAFLHCCLRDRYVYSWSYVMHCCWMPVRS